MKNMTELMIIFILTLSLGVFHWGSAWAESKSDKIGRLKLKLCSEDLAQMQETSRKTELALERIERLLADMPHQSRYTDSRVDLENAKADIHIFLEGIRHQLYSTLEVCHLITRRDSKREIYRAMNSGLESAYTHPRLLQLQLVAD